MPPRLGEILVKEGACSAAVLRDALQNQVIFGGRLGTNLLEIHGVAEDALARALGKQHAMPALAGDVRLSPQATALLTAEIADRCEAVPYLIVDRRLALLVADPRNLAALDEVAFATGKQIHPIVVPEARIWALLRRTYGIERNLRGIDVDFAWLGARGIRVPAPAPAADAAVRDPGADLMAEEDFSALYEGRPAGERTFVLPGDGPRGRGGAASHAPGRAAALEASHEEDVIDLTDLVAEPDAAGDPSARSPVPDAPAGHPGGARAAPPVQVPAREPAQPEPSPLTFVEAVRFLEGVDERSAIAKTVLRYARSKFRRAVLLTVHRGGAHGWAGLGERLSPEGVRRMHLALGTPGILDTVVRTRAHFLGPIPKTEANVRLLKALGGGVPANALVVPILVLGRVVNLFYADNGRGGVVESGDVGELLILATRIARSYDALLERVR